MLQSFSLLCSRAKRHHHILPVVYCSTPEILAAVITAANKKECPIAVCLDEAAVFSLTFSIFINLACLLAAESSSPVAVVAEVTAEKQSVYNALEAGAPALSLVRTHLGQRTHKEFMTWMVKEAAKQHVEVIGGLAGLSSAAKIESFLEETGLGLLSVPIGVMSQQRPEISFQYVRQLVKDARVPLIAQAMPISPRVWQNAAECGVAAFFLDAHELEEAYTAGVRAGLHDRSQTSPGHYQGRGMQAVAQAVTHYLDS